MYIVGRLVGLLRKEKNLSKFLQKSYWQILMLSIALEDTNTPTYPPPRPGWASCLLLLPTSVSELFAIFLGSLLRRAVFILRLFVLPCSIHCEALLLSLLRVPFLSARLPSPPLCLRYILFSGATFRLAHSLVLTGQTLVELESLLQKLELSWRTRQVRLNVRMENGFIDVSFPF